MSTNCESSRAIAELYYIDLRGPYSSTLNSSTHPAPPVSQNLGENIIISNYEADDKQ